MLRLTALSAISLFLLFPIAATARSRAQSDPLALALAVKSIGMLTGGTTISDVTLNGDATWITGSDKQTGAVTLTALGFGESRVDLTLHQNCRIAVFLFSPAQTSPRHTSSGT